MAKKNTVTVKITKLEYGRNAKLFCNTVLMLRTACKVGDVETVNHTVLSRLNQQRGTKFDFKIVSL